MDGHHFDALTRKLTPAGSRRSLLGVLAATPVAGGLLALVAPDDGNAKGRRKRRKKRHKHGKGRRRKARKPCKPQAKSTTCAGRCGSVTNNCQKTVDCGSCDCPSPCGDCQICQSGPNTPGDCVPDAAQDGDACDDGNLCAPGSTCNAGVCGGGAPVVCPATDCQIPGACNPDSGLCTSPGNKPPDSPCTSQPCGLCSNAGVCVAHAACSGTTPICDGVSCQPCSQLNPCPVGQCCAADGSCGACLVFVTSETYQGNLGGLTGADDLCQARAEAASLSGTYMAWLSDDTGSPSTRFTQATAPYMLRDGTTIADNWADLIDGALGAPISVSESGSSIDNSVWSNTTSAGAIENTNWDCNNWTTSVYDEHAGSFGLSDKTDAGWTSFSRKGCGPPLSGANLYCFQQA